MRNLSRDLNVAVTLAAVVSQLALAEVLDVSKEKNFYWETFDPPAGADQDAVSGDLTWKASVYIRPIYLGGSRYPSHHDEMKELGVDVL